MASLLAQVNISGTVRDQKKQPVAGVTVSLGGLRIVSTTDASGHYQLTGSTATRAVSGAGAFDAGPALKNGLLRFSVNDDKTNVHIALYDLSGRSLSSIANREMSRGDYTVNPYVKALASQTCFLSVEIGNDKRVLKIQAIDNDLRRTSSMAWAEIHAERSFSKVLAVKDSIKVKKPGYSYEQKVIAAYTGTYDFIVTDTAWFWGDITKIPKATQVLTYVFLNRTNGKYTDDQIFWTFNNITKTIAQQSTYDMPANSSGRVTFHLGTANSQYWDFMEHTISATRWYGNTTRVDGWALPLAIRLHCSDGYDAMLGEVYHVFTMDRDTIFADYKRSVPAEFVHCADKGYPYRMIAPGKGDGGFGPGQQYANYMTPYLAQIGQSATTEQVFSCSGNPFGSNAQLAGAVNRHVAHLPQAQWKDSTQYYKAAPANFYAKYWHDNSFGWKCYGFAYDDAEQQAAYTEHSGPQYLIIAIGY
jgi:hypothetical protein